MSSQSSRERSLACAKDAVRRIVAERHDRPSLVAEIACEIGAEIIEGVRRPGDDLNSVELSHRYSTSRTPVREALMLLEKEGLVDVPPRRRPRVMTFDIAEIRDIYRARAALFELVAADVANHASEAEIATLRASVEEMARACEADDLSMYFWGNVTFHEHNTRIANNRIVKRIIDSLLLRTLPLRRLSLSYEGRMLESLDDHLHLVRAYEKRDANLAAALIRSNHINALATLEKILR